MQRSMIRERDAAEEDDPAAGRWGDRAQRPKPVESGRSSLRQRVSTVRVPLSPILSQAWPTTRLSDRRETALQRTVFRFKLPDSHLKLCYVTPLYAVYPFPLSVLRVANVRESQCILEGQTSIHQAIDLAQFRLVQNRAENFQVLRERTIDRKRVFKPKAYQFGTPPDDCGVVASTFLLIYQNKFYAVECVPSAAVPVHRKS